METERTKKAKPRFELGRLAITPQAEATLSGQEIIVALFRHWRGDWGILCPEDWQENESALIHHHRLFSVYDTADGAGRFYVITEADRSVTTVLLPDDY